MHELAQALVSEFRAVASARKVASLDNMLDVVYDIANRTKHNTSSMLSDMERFVSITIFNVDWCLKVLIFYLCRCVQTEIEYLNGFLIREGPTAWCANPVQQRPLPNSQGAGEF